MTNPGAGCHLQSFHLVGQSPATTRLRAEIQRVAVFSSTVLITGPSGTGKELVARQIHALSPRADGPFIPVDCASMTGELMASQLFGHVAGAFTGANCNALGCIRAANHGTLFLDEIGELEYAVQAKLLRVLQERVVTPVGSHRGEAVDVRVLAATNRDLRSEVRSGKFREDLYYRLDVVHLRTASLRERPSDILHLADEFLKQLADAGLPRCALAPQGMAVLVDFHWPGNVRQLRNVLEQAVIDSPTPILSAELLQRIISLSFAAPDDFAREEGGAASAAGEPRYCPETQGNATEEGSRHPSAVGRQQNGSEQFEPTAAAWLTLEDLERQHIRLTLERTFYNRSAAARLLGVTRQALLRKMKRYGI
jgi:DNA-binding NtrC family response regulator